MLRRTTAAFVGISASMGDALVRMGIDPDRVVVIPNGCPVPRRTGHRDPEHDRDPARGPTIGVVGRLEPHKRVDLFLDVLSELRRRGVNCAGLVVGDGSLRDELIHHRNALGLGDAVEVVGNQHDVVPWLDRLQVFMVTSEIEPFGIAALEAMARGVPVVGMPCPGGLAELLEGGGLLLPDREIATAADALQTVLASATEQSRLRSRGDAAVEEFSLARTVDRLDELYASLIRPTPESDVGPAPRAVRLRSAVRRSASRRSRRG